MFERESEVYHSCSIVLSGLMWVFGGKNEGSQLSLVEECHLRRVGKMSFSAVDATVGLVGESDKESVAMLCFSSSSREPKDCHS